MRVAAKTRRKKKARAVEPRFIGQHLVVDPHVCHGELTFRGTRVPVETVLRYLANGYSIAYVRKSWPRVSVAAIQEAIRLASDEFVQRYRSKKS